MQTLYFFCILRSKIETLRMSLKHLPISFLLIVDTWLLFMICSRDEVLVVFGLENVDEGDIGSSDKT